MSLKLINSQNAFGGKREREKKFLSSHPKTGYLIFDYFF